MVLCSHEHSDHGYTQAVQIRENGPENPFQITKIDTFHDDASGSMRGPNRIHLNKAGEIALVHAGRYADAVRLIRKDNPFPVACAYICEHPCEAHCRRMYS